MSRTTGDHAAGSGRRQGPPRRARRVRRPLQAGLAGLVVASLAIPASAAQDDTILVSRTSAGAAATAPSDAASISADGRVVAFESSADNLSADDDDAVQNVFARDLVTGVTTLVSRGTGANAPGGADSSNRPSVSADGRLVVFSSLADSLSTEDNDAVRNIYVRDLVAGTTTLVSRATGAGGAAADGVSDLAVVSADGRFVAFESAADNLSAEDDNTVTNVFVRDLVAGTTSLASRVSGPTGIGANGTSGWATISSDGRYVAFDSLADNLSAVDDNNVNNVFVRDLGSGTTFLASRADGIGSAGGTDSSSSPSISGDGRYVAFDSAADNLSTADDDAVRNVFVHDLDTGSTTLVSRATGAVGAGGDGGSFFPEFSRDGRRVAFDSAADNLSGEDDDTVTDVFVRDLAAGATTLVSRAPGANGAGGDGSSVEASISGDGGVIAFASDADNLSTADDDAVTDIFVRDFRPATGAGQGPGGGGVGQGPGPVVSVRCAGLRATIVGTARRDVLRGTPRRDVIAALGGNDRVLGLGGNDVICLGAGADRAAGGAGADRILGGAGGDRIAGGGGRDVLLGGAGRDLLLGGAGRDRLVGGAGRDGVRP